MAEEVLEHYPGTNDNRDNMGSIEQDGIFDCPTRRLLRGVTTSFKGSSVFQRLSTMSTRHIIEYQFWPLKQCVSKC